MAREAAALVLLDDDFASIVGAVRLGRRIYDNLKKAMAYLLAVHVPIAGHRRCCRCCSAGRWSWCRSHIVFLELIIDPACSLAFEAEPEERDVMARPPARPGRAAVQPAHGCARPAPGRPASCSSILALFGVVLARGQGELEARAMTFTTLIVANLALILTNRSWSRTILGTLGARNLVLWLVVVGALVVLGLVLYVPWLRELFGFSVLHPDDLAICLAAGLASVAWFEALKLVLRRRGGEPPRRDQAG